MTSKRYLILTMGLLLGLPALWVGYNFVANDFGLWYTRQDCRIYEYERASKLLLTKRYIPDNFNGLLIGPSFSDNMDTHFIEQAKVYNLSINGGNITELKVLAKSAIDSGKIDLLIVCLNPYMTKNYGMKTNQLDSTSKWRSLYGDIAVKVLLSKITQAWGSKRAKQFASSQWGSSKFHKTQREIQRFAKSFDKKQTGDHDDDQIRPIVISEHALDDLDQTLRYARSHHVRIFAYYFPFYRGQFNTIYGKTGWAAYKQQVEHVFEPGEKIIDFNDDAYADFASNIKHYSDGHLSNKGAMALSKILGRFVDQWCTQQQFAWINKTASHRQD